uniref:hypothetical protein n=1 Tax=Alistipes communis TaxID=2585118 RepID=UPI003AB5FCCE
ENVFASVYAKRVDLHQGSTNLDIFGRLDTAQGEFDRLYNLAIGGDADAAKEMAGVAGELLNLRGETTANRDAYLDAFYDVDKKLKEVGALANSQASDAQKQLTTLQAQLDAENAQYSVLVSQLEAQQAALSALSGQNQTLAGIQSQIANLKTQINITVQGQQSASTVVDNAQKDYDHAKDQVEQTKPGGTGTPTNPGGTDTPTNPYTGVYGSKYPSDHALCQAKADAMNADKVPNDITPGKPWTAIDIMVAIYRNKMTTRQWYEKHGKDEGFARGGLAMPGGGKFFGEEGIEYGDVARPTRVYDAQKTLLMQENAYDFARDAYEGMAEMSRLLRGFLTPTGTSAKEDRLQDELREVKDILRALLTRTDDGIGLTRRQARLIQKWDQEGMPKERVS